MQARPEKSAASRGIGLLLALMGLLAGCAPESPAKPRPVEEVFFPKKLRELDAAIETAIQNQKCPGGVLWLEREGTVYARAYGHRALVPKPEPMTVDTIFDLASLTKVVATTPAVMLLVEAGRLDLNAPVARYLPEFAAHGKAAITLRQLLTHTSGLRPDISLKPDWRGAEAAIRLACAEVPRCAPDERFIYSDTGPILLAEIVRRVSGERFDVFAARRIFHPLKMWETGFNPPARLRDRIAPTTVENGKVTRGVVHDPRARRMGGVAGHAGLFSTAHDLARFARMMLNGGALDGVRLFRPETVRLMTSVQTPPPVKARRGLGWDIDSPYAGERGSVFPLGGYGHTGWTGGSIWIDPFSRTFVIFLSNRNHPTEKGSVIALRRQIGTLAAEAVRDFDFQHVPGALSPFTEKTPAASKPAAPPADPAQPSPKPAPPAEETGVVLNGIDVLVAEHFAPLAGLRVGLVTNHTGQDRQRRSTVDLLHAATNVQLVALFSPEHGVRGDVEARVADSVDAATGLPIYSLYDDTRQPQPGELEGLDALVFDIQDIGCRFYTYIATMGLCLEAAAQAGLRFFVLDRVNPITGTRVDGPVYHGAPEFTCFHDLPIRHGMTVGELARMFNAERGWGARLTVVPLKHWRRAMWFDQTGLPWRNPSPNIRNVTQAALYPGIGLLETTPLSVGRGTDTPFEVIGAPYIDDLRLAAELNRAGLTGLRFVPVRFTPRASVFQGRECGGVQILLLDRERADVLAAGLTIAATLHRLHPQSFPLERFNRLLRDPATLKALRAGRPVAEIRAGWEAGLREFKKRRAAFLLY
jgi:uncharacterized protein YbbC (DUF1343 family)/CubicO group peptidase (beta-lactamase class C family)